MSMVMAIMLNLNEKEKANSVKQLYEKNTRRTGIFLYKNREKKGANDIPGSDWFVRRPFFLL